MKHCYKKILFGFALILISTISFGQSKPSKTNWDKLIVGKWINKSNKTIDGDEFKEAECRDTIQYLSNGKYLSDQCTWKADGKWKLSNDKKYIIHYDINSDYWRKILGTDDLGESRSEIISISESQFVKVIYSEDQGEIHRFYQRIE